MVCISMPTFFLATVLKFAFAVKLNWFDLYGITGAAFEANNNLYTNYQLVVSANVMKNGSTYGGISDASNFVIYTHAKVLSDFIRTN